MSVMKAENGQVVTDDMINSWCESLDKDEWPSGWRNVGNIVDGKPKPSSSNSEVISVKVPAGMKRAIEREAKNKGVSTSNYVRSSLADSLISMS